MLGTVAMFDFDWVEVERQFRLAMAHGAVPSRVHRYYAHYCLLPTGRAAEAVQYYDVGLSEDPLNLQFRAELALCLRAAGRLEDGDEELRRIMRIDESFWFPHFVLGVNRALDGHLDEAVAISERAFELAPWFKPIVGFRAAMLRRIGHFEAANQLRERAPGAGRSICAIPSDQRCFICSVASWMKRRTGSETAIEQRQVAILFFLNAHATALRSTPRWPALAKMMNLSGVSA